MEPTYSDWTITFAPEDKKQPPGFLDFYINQTDGIIVFSHKLQRAIQSNLPKKMSDHEGKSLEEFIGFLNQLVERGSNNPLKDEIPFEEDIHRLEDSLRVRLFNLAALKEAQKVA